MSVPKIELQEPLWDIWGEPGDLKVTPSPQPAPARADRPPPACSPVPADPSVGELRGQIMSELGFSLLYMHFLHPDVDWGGQHESVADLCREYADGRRLHWEDTPANRAWAQDLLDRVSDEIENQC